MYVLNGFCASSQNYKKHSPSSVPIFDRAGSQWHGLFKQHIITADEMWIYCYNPVVKQQTSKWVLRGFPHSLKSHTTKLKMKCMVIAFFNWEGLLYMNSVPAGQTVNADWYVKVLKRLITVHIPQKRPMIDGSSIKITYARIQRSVFGISWPCMV